MGLAIIWVVFFHSGVQLHFLPINIVKMLGYGGVDIFIFASGIGCWYSLNKDNDCYRFIKRRATRLMPIYLVFLPVWLLVSVCTTVRFTINDIVGNVLCIQWFTGKSKDVNWYISGIWFLYFLSPFIYSYISSSKTKWRYLKIIAVSLAMTLPFWDVHTYIVFTTRIPLFVIGMVMAQITYKREVLPKSWWGLSMIISLFGVALVLLSYVYLQPFLWDRGLWWYPFILITPGICLGISLLGNSIAATKIGKKIVELIDVVGAHSLEVLLAQILVFNYMTFLIDMYHVRISNLAWFGSLGVVALLAFLISIVSQWVKNKLLK